MGDEIPTIAEAARRLKARTLSPVELTQACLARVKRLDPQLNAFIAVTEEIALAGARAAEAAIMKDGPRGPLHGIPLGIKDIFNTKGIATTAHSRQLIGNVPDHDAAATERLAAAGSVLMGKLATHEFAFGGPSFDLPWPPARNPWNPDHFTGGSSSGTGAAIASGMVLGGLGSDTGGSIRGPAAFCGIAGIKPTYGRVSRHGVLPLAWTLDHVGPMAWTAEDCALLLQALAGHDARDPACADRPVPDYSAGLAKGVKGLRIGVINHFFERDHRVSDATLKAVGDALQVFRGLGAEVREVTLSPLDDWYAAGFLIMICEAFSIHEEWMKTRPQNYGERFYDRIAMAAFVSSADYIQAQRRRRELVSEMDAAMVDLDILVSVSMPGEAPRIDAVPKWQSFDAPAHNMPFNVTGYPAMSICCGYGEQGLPLAIQLVAAPFAEATLLRAAHAYEQATSWRARRPKLVAS
jgi:aspartyl-tRNA(Asn)/glutamyl-tRNA(Gln) amidotransferase subunit A